LCGRQSCLQAAFQAAVQRTTHAVRSGFPGLRCTMHMRPDFGLALCTYEPFSLSTRAQIDLQDGISPASCRPALKRREKVVRSMQLRIRVGQAILPVRMGLRPMKGDENLAEVQLSCSFFDARTGGRVADRVNRKGEAFDRAAAFQAALRTWTEQPSRTKGFLRPRVVTRVRREAREIRQTSRKPAAAKIGCQDWLPHERAKVQRRPERPPAGTIAFHTQSSRASSRCACTICSF
jgi:hypothetical protein